MHPHAEYLQMVVVLHVAFAAVFAFIHRQRTTRFAHLFAWCWGIEAFRAAILLPAVHQLGGQPEVWYATSDVLAFVTNACLVAGFADLVETRVLRWVYRVYLATGIPLVLFNRFVLPALLMAVTELDRDQALFWGVSINLMLMFIPIAVSRLLIVVWIFRLWRRKRLPGAGIAALFCLPYAGFAFAAPFQFIYDYQPDWIFFVWCIRVLGISIGMVIMMLSLQHVAIDRSEQSMRAAQRLAKLGSWEWDLQEQRMWWSETMYALFGRPVEQGPMTFAELLAVTDEQDRGLLREMYDRVQSGEPASFECRIHQPDGSVRYIAERTIPHRDVMGRLIRLSGTAQDVTERRAAEVRIEHLNRVYAVLSDINQTIVRVQTTDEVFTAACAIAVEKGGLRMAWIGQVDVANGRLSIVAHAGADAHVLGVIERVLADIKEDRGCHHTTQALRHGVSATCNDIATAPEAEHWRAEALAVGYRSMTSLPLKVRGVTIGTFNLYAGEPHFFDDREMRLLDELAIDIGFAVEIHQRERERQRAVQALHDSEERFRQLTETIREVFWLVDPLHDRMLYVSPAYEAIWGRSREELYADGKAWATAVHPDDHDAVLREMARLIEGTEYDQQYRIVHPSGVIRWIHARAFPVRDADGGIYRIAGVAEDITERKQLEEQFRQAQKLEALGQFSGGIAHDFNNLLTVIIGRVQLLRADTLPPEVDDGLEEIIQAADRAANLTRQLLMFSRRQVLEPRVIDLNAVVAGLARMLQRIVGEDITLQVRTTSAPVLVHGDAGMLEQVLMNLVVNARDAMPRGGRLQIATEVIYRGGDPDAVDPQDRAAAFAQLLVVDSGIGIPPEIMPRIFEPFFTTKDVGKGTGLGLSTVFGIVKQHGGWIDVHSTPGQGTRFELHFPVHRTTEATDDVVAASGPSAPVFSGTILLVEDDPAVRRVARLSLTRAGYRVLEAAAAAEAFVIWQSHRAEIDLLLTDLVMPEGVSGHELAQRLVTEKLRLGIIYTSGYSPEIAGRGLTLSEGVNFLPKPYDRQRLLESVRAMLQWTRRQAAGHSRPPIGPMAE